MRIFVPTFVALAVVVASLATSGAATVQESNFPSASLKKIDKGLADYFRAREKNELNNAQRKLGDVQKELDSLAKKNDGDDTLSQVEEWRLLVRRALTPDRVGKQFGRFGTKPTELDQFPSSLIELRNPRALDKEKLFDGKLKAWVSAPKDYDKVAYPVVIAMHPQVPGEENDIPIDSLTKGADIVQKSLEWVQTMYPESILDRVIVVAPIMDLVILDSSELTGHRPRWNDPTDMGMYWVLSALRDLVLFGMNFDASRMFYDGAPDASTAAVLFSSRFPAMLSGALIRGPISPKQRLVNCRSSQLLFVGDEAKGRYDELAAEGTYHVSHVDSLDAEQMVEWIQGHSKIYAPKKIHLEGKELPYLEAHWLRVADLQFTLDMEAAVDAEIKPDENEILVSVNRKVRGFTLYLNDSMLDLDKKIRVLVRTLSEDEADLEPKVEVRYEGTVGRLLHEMLDNAFRGSPGNIGEVYVTHLNIDVNS